MFQNFANINLEVKNFLDHFSELFQTKNFLSLNFMKRLEIRNSSILKLKSVFLRAKFQISDFDLCSLFYRRLILVKVNHHSL